MLDHVAKQIQQLASEDARLNFSKALAWSIDLKQGSSHPKPWSPSDIQEKWGVSPSDQAQYGISLTISAAHDFLRMNGKKITLQRVKKSVKDENFSQLFGRKACRLDARGTYIVTYAELLYLVDFVFEIPYPKSLKSYL